MKSCKFIRFIPIVLLVLFVILTVGNTFLSGDARDIGNTAVNILMYIFAGVSLVFAVISCICDIRTKKAKATGYVLLSLLFIALWAFLLYLNASFMG